MYRVATATISAPPAGGRQSAGSKPPQYTTAGTIYNPDASQPLQPPLRRGRALKWASSAPLDFGHLGIYSNDPFQDLNLPLQRLHDLQSLRHEAKATPPTYQLLQQNLERAVNPQAARSSRLATEPLGHYSVASSTNLSQKSLAHDLKKAIPRMPLYEVMDPNAISPSGSAKTSDNQAGYEVSNATSLDQLPVKALFSLMSYPNPNREQARLRWEAAKGGCSTPAEPARSLGVPTGPRAMFPASKLAPQATSAPAVHDTFPGSNDIKSVRFRRPDRSAAHKYVGHPTTFPQPTSYPTHSLQHSSSHSHFAPPPHPSFHPNFSSHHDTLAITGAPPPLTAGPPGHRQRPTMQHAALEKVFDAKALCVSVREVTHQGNDGYDLLRDLRDLPRGDLQLFGRYDSGPVCDDLVASEGSAAILNSEPDDPSFADSSNIGILAPPARRHESFGSNVVAGLEAQAHLGAPVRPIGSKPDPDVNEPKPSTGRSDPTPHSTWSVRRTSPAGSGIPWVRTAAEIPPRHESIGGPNPNSRTSWKKDVNRVWYSGSRKLSQRLGGPTDPVKNDMSIGEMIKPLLLIAADRIEEFVLSGEYHAGLTRSEWEPMSGHHPHEPAEEDYKE